MPEVDTITYPVEQLIDFSRCTFMHFGVPEKDAAVAAEVLACK